MVSHVRLEELTILTIARVAHSTLDNTSSLEYGLDTNFELFDIVQRVKNTENVNTVLLCLLTEVKDGIIR